MYLRQRNNKWQCLVRVKGIKIVQSFIAKADARTWANKQEVQK